MPRGDKSAYSNKQKRMARHIEKGYEERGVSEDEAERRGWATVNKESGGGNKSGSGRGVPDTTTSARKGGRLGGRASASRSRSQHVASARKGAATRKRRASATAKRKTSTRKTTARKATARRTGTRAAAARKTNTRTARPRKTTSRSAKGTGRGTARKATTRKAVTRKTATRKARARTPRSMMGRLLKKAGFDL
jgi:hypothetical protein